MAGINRYYSSTKYVSRAEFVGRGLSCVFISHQKKDRVEAKEVADYLINAEVDVYFDEYDGDLKIHHQNGNPKLVTDSICNGINNSSHMLAIVSPNTVNSTWVPFEIGFGYDKTDLMVLCLKGLPKGSLPEYARVAKIIRDIYDLNIHIANLTGYSKDYLLSIKRIRDYDSFENPLSKVMDGLINDVY